MAIDSKIDLILGANLYLKGLNTSCNVKFNNTLPSLHKIRLMSYSSLDFEQFVNNAMVYVSSARIIE